MRETATRENRDRARLEECLMEIQASAHEAAKLIAQLLPPTPPPSRPAPRPKRAA